MARLLGIPAKTVAHHVAHVDVKAGVRSRAGGSHSAMEHRLLEARPGPGGGCAGTLAG
jgi:DNA-binding CsgD family transcriptional regulator